MRLKGKDIKTSLWLILESTGVVYNSVLPWILNLILYLASKFLDPARTARIIKDGVGTAWRDGNIFKRDPKSGDFPRFRMTVLISA